MSKMKIKYDATGFGKALKTKRIIEDNIDLRELAKKTKISIATLSRVERGRMPDLNTYANLCQWLGCDPKQFLIKSSKK